MLPDLMILIKTTLLLLLPTGTPCALKFKKKGELYFYFQILLKALIMVKIKYSPVLELFYVFFFFYLHLLPRGHNADLWLKLSSMYWKLPNLNFQPELLSFYYWNIPRIQLTLTSMPTTLIQAEHKLPVY